MKWRERIVCALGLYLPHAHAQGNTTCKGTSLDWYTSVVGETPCQTYEQLRQICNSAYTVGSLQTATPGDSCDEQLADCCCNSVSFALSMLCLNCQQGVGAGLNGDNGIDAGAGAYQLYLQRGDGKRCGPNVNQSLPVGIQAAVCNTKLKIEDDLYGLFWNTGDWFYMYTRQTITKDHLVFNNNTFTHCASTTIDNSTSSTTASTTALTSSALTSPASTTISGHAASSAAASSTNSNSKQMLNGATIGGIAAGGITLLLIVGFVICLFRRRGRRNMKYDAVAAALNREMEEAPHVVEPFLRPHPPATRSQAASSVAPSGVSTQMSSSSVTSTAPMQPLNEKRRLPTPPKLPLISSARLDVSQTTAMTTTTPEDRHVDGGPLPEGLLQRSLSGRLPPAYGEQRR